MNPVHAGVDLAPVGASKSLYDFLNNKTDYLIILLNKKINIKYSVNS